ncbi:MAG: hypothetical protein IKJ81_09470 [Bacteroidales bacterium]|nr:hypothetical protein [Bacteroidales bacterium]
MICGLQILILSSVGLQIRRNGSMGNKYNEESGAIHYVSIFSCKGLDFPVM